ncbi:MAG: hypothetical protein L0210_07145 [Rhodospirillales bacterium]|nr:hypothetical protein [Rhodospirillales bacterium]
MTDLLPAEAGASTAAQPRHWKEVAAEARAGRTGRIAREVEDCLGVEEMPASEIRDDRRLAVAAALADITPGDEVEAQLASQLLTVHGLVVDCVRAARDTLKEERVRLAYLSHAARMVSLYARHIDKLEQRRDAAEYRAIARRERAETALLEAALRGSLGPARNGAKAAETGTGPTV